MDDELDAMFVRLANQPLPPRLQQLEARVRGALMEGSRAATARSWRYAAVGLALVAGVSVGGSTAALRERPVSADLSGGVRLAPSTLLGASL